MIDKDLRFEILLGKHDRKNTGKRLRWKTGIRTDIANVKQQKVCKGRGWHIEFSKAVESELIVAADNISRAEDAIRLFICAATLENQRLCEISQDEQGRYGWQPKYFPMALKNEKSLFKVNIENAYWAARLAARASQRTKWKYALSRLWTSHKICSTDFSLTHHHSVANEGFYKHEVFQAMFAQAIVAAYGVIEELNLELKPNPRTRSFHNGSNWDEEAFEDLDSRLQEINISASSHYYWVVRNQQRTLEKKYPFKNPKLVHKKPIPSNNKDVFIPWIDALYRAGRLRSKVAAHEFTKLTETLSPLDVLNIQSLSRNLLLLKMGLGHEDRYAKIAVF